MIKRKGITLLEVLISIFIMGIGMLSVLAMFPAAADMMGRAITNSQIAEGLVNARGMQDGVDWTSSAYSNFVNAITPTNPGTGYISPPSITISGGGGNGATAIAVVTAGTVASYTVINPGTGYTSVPTVTITGGGGSGATAVATIGGLLNVPIKNPNPNNPVITINTGWFNQPGSETPSFLLLDQFAVVGGVTRFSNLPIEVGAISAGNAAGIFFTCNSDLILNKSGVANLDDDGNSIPVEREAKFTIAHFFTKPMPITYPNYIKRNILVFKDRSQVITSNDFTYYPISSFISTNQFTLSVNANGVLKTRQWVMITDSLANAYPTAVDFYEISSVDDSGTYTTIEISPSLPSTGFGTGAKSVYLLKDVAKVIYTGN